MKRIWVALAGCVVALGIGVPAVRAAEPLCEAHVVAQHEINVARARELGFDPGWQYARVA